jgi:hypothetical protein
MGESWDTTFNNTPVDGDGAGGGNEEIQDTRKETANRANTEHAWNSTSIDGEPIDTGRHREGSARAFYESAQPTTLKAADYSPTTSTSPNNGSNALDPGRLWVDSDNKQLYVNTGAGATWSPVTTIPASGSGSVPANRFINPYLNINQQFGSTATTASADLTTTPLYTVDGWYGYVSESGGMAVKQRLDTGVVPALGDFTTAGATYIVPHGSLRMYMDTADGAWSPSTSTTDVIRMSHPIEGHRIRDFFGRTVNIYFWFRSTESATYTLALHSTGNARYYLTNFTVVANTWTLVSKTVNWDTFSGSWDVTENRGVLVSVVLAAGNGNESAVSETWTTTGGSAWRLTGATHTFPTGANSAYMTLPVIGLALASGNYQITDIGYEVEACQRYYQKSYDLATRVGTAPNTVGICQSGGDGFELQLEVGGGSGPTTRAQLKPLAQRCQVCFPVRMRTVPTVTMWSTVTSDTSGVVYSAQQGIDTSAAVSAQGTGERGFACETTPNVWGTPDTSNPVNITIDPRFWFHWVADARLT